MPRRKQSINTGQIYHVYNHTTNGQPAFTHTQHYQRATEAIWYYRYHKPPYKLSSYRTLNNIQKPKFLDTLHNHPKAVDVICFTLTTDHIQLILKQNIDNGISRYMANIQNSYTRYFNARAKRQGQLFTTQFFADQLHNDNQIIQTSHSIHRLPLSRTNIGINELRQYTWSSLPEYAGDKPNVLSFCHKEPIMNHFSSPQDYLNFITNP